MGFSRFGLLIGIRLTIILCLLAVIGWLFVAGGYPTSVLLLALLALMLTAELFRFVSKTNHEIARFLDAARYADYGQRFQYPHLGAGFSELGETFSFIMARFSEARNQQEEELRHLRALLEHVPVPLMSLHGDHQISLWNNAARRLFGSSKIVRLEDVGEFGAELPQQLLALKAGERELMHFRIDEQTQALSVGVGELSIGANTEKLISLQNIQTELDTMQLQAWQDLVRVLTHEIMNSLTPVTSLAKTAVSLVGDITQEADHNASLIAELNDVKQAVETVARRSEGLTNFVGSYRALAQSPTPQKSRFVVADLFSDIDRMVRSGLPMDQVSFACVVEPKGLELIADRQLVEQILLNLLRNAQQATQTLGDPRIDLIAHLHPRGGVMIEVLDNGPGVAAELTDRVFVPFFTTRKDGTGVGLALSRQIMLVHGGTISYATAESGGARFSLAF